MSNVKFQRTFRVTIDLGDGSDPIVIGPPLTIKFTVNRTLNSSLNTLKIDIYNLGKQVRDTIFQEFYGAERKKTITFEAGYAGALSTLFKGTIFQAFSYRENVDIVTSIESRSGTWEIGQSLTYTTLPKQTSVRDVLLYLSGRMQPLEIGAIGEFDDVLLRPVVINGSTWEYVKKYSENQSFIDNDKIYILKKNETIQGQYNLINKDTGLLQTPRRQGAFLNVVLLFEPRLTIGQQVELKSDILPIYDGNYKVNGLQHTGTISEAVAESAQTTVDLFIDAVQWKQILEENV